MSSGARDSGGALHSLSIQPPPQAWPASEKEANEMNEARRLKNIVKKQQQGLRAKETGLEASSQARRDAETRQLVKDVTSFIVEIAFDIACARERTKTAQAALIIQWAWRTKTVRTRYARTCALKVAEKRRQRWAVRSIEKAWRQFRDRKALAYEVEGVDEKIAPHRRRTTEMMRAAIDVEGAEAADKSNDGLASEHSSAVAGLAEEVRPHKATVGVAATQAAPSAGTTAAQLTSIGVSGQVSGRLGDVLLNTIRALLRLQEEEAAVRAAESAQARAEMEADITAIEGARVAPEEAQAVKRAALERELLRATLQGLHRQCIEDREKEEENIARRRSMLRLPPARKHHPAGPTENLVPRHFQPLEGQTLRYSQQEFDVWAAMGQLQGWALQLGKAPVWGGGAPRAAEQYSVACGFSAAFGPLLFEHATGKVFGKGLSSGMGGESPADHIGHILAEFWENEIFPFDAVERLYRLVGGSGRGGIVKEDLQPFLLEIARRHPHLAMMAPDDVSAYVETVLAVVFYRHSRCGVINLRGLRTSGFVEILNATGRLEIGLEDSEYFSLARHNTIRGEYLSLCQDGRGVRHEALRGYRHHNGPVVGTLRASRIIDADLRQRPRCNSPGVDGPFMGGRGKELSYDGWVRFYLCEEALMAGECTEPDLKYSFDLVDDAGVGWVRLKEVAPFYEDMTREFVNNGGNADEVVDCRTTFCEHLDAMGVRAGREYVTLVEMRKPGNVKIAGRFFSQLFLGLDFNDDSSAANEHAGNYQSPPPPTIYGAVPAVSANPGAAAAPAAPGAPAASAAAIQQQSQQYCQQQKYHKQHQEQHQEQHKESYQEPKQEPKQQYQEPQQHHQQQDQQFHYDYHQQQQQQSQQYCYQQQYYLQYCYQQQFHQQYQEQHQEPYQETCQQQNQEQQQHQETQQQHRDPQQRQQEQSQQYCYHQQFHYQQHQQQGHPNYCYQQHQDHQQQQQQSEQHCYQQQYHQQYQDHHQDPYLETFQLLHYHQQQQEACQQFLYQQQSCQQLQELNHYHQQQYHQMCQTWGAGYLSEMGYVGDSHVCCS
eukprot:jgi/Undpi1/10123/HiC_scaffold_28.g12577.m1